VAVLPGGSFERELEQAGITNIEAIDDPQRCAKMLQAGRADAWYTLDVRAAYTWKKSGFPAEALVLGKPTSRQHMFIAGNKDIAPEIKQKLQAAYDSMVRDGTYASLVRKYFGATY
jgi:ABC-type amino acid transport substrate-binding protein